MQLPGRTSPYALILAFLAAWAAPAAADWPSLRGPDHDGAARNAALLAGESAALEVAWRAPLGSGYSSVVVSDGRVYTMFDGGEDDVLAAFDTAAGEEVWRYRIDATYDGHDGSHDGPVSTPALGQGAVFGLSPRGHLFAVDAATGEERWRVDLVETHGAEKPHYGFTSSPVVAGGAVIVEVGGEGQTVAGFDLTTGEKLWSLGDGTVRYQSPVVTTLGGRSLVLAANNSHLYGIDPASGELLWSHEHGGDESGMGGQSLVPVPAGDDRVLLGHKSDASVMLRISAEGGVEELWSNPTLKASYVVPVAHEGTVYGMNNRIFTAVDAETGEIRWRSREPGDGFPTLVGDHLVVITKPGTLHVVEATPEEYREVAQLELFDDHSWSAVAYADGHLYARSMAELARIDASAARRAAEPAGVWLAATDFGDFLAEVDAAPAGDRQALVEAFLAEQDSIPVVESSGAVHFLYRGEAQDVGIVGDMIGFRREDPMTPIEGTDLFYYSTRLEPDAAVAYGFIPDYGDTVADPLNQEAAESLFGEVSWLAMPAWDRPVWSDTEESESADAGRMEALEWTSEVREGQERKAQVYLPAGYAASGERRYPVLYVHAGQDALEKCHLSRALDRILGSSVEPLIAVFVETDPENRRDMGEGYGEMLVQELIPMVDAKYRTRTGPMDRGTVGFNNAGTPALTLAMAHPEVFGKVAVEAPTLMTAERVAGSLGDPAAATTVIYHAWGRYHLRSPHEAWDMVHANRDLWELLQESGYHPVGGEHRDGFAWRACEARADDWLEALFPVSTGS